ncbi:HNH endonuclease [Paenibacillus sp. GYB004]|uniref:HNH endonuclease n=1 Tax=Paenibacillus sp. GYB004 TaxID=2994393 RepID=UPI003FA755DD
MSRMKNKMFLMGDYVDAYRCDQCGQKEISACLHWEKKNFTLCANCLSKAHKELFPEHIPSNTQCKKKKIPKSIRMAVFTRDGFRCRYCGSEENLTADHVTPESRGGATTVNNLMTACNTCNLKKGARTPVEAGMEILAINDERVR